MRSCLASAHGSTADSAHSGLTAAGSTLGRRPSSRRLTVSRPATSGANGIEPVPDSSATSVGTPFSAYSTAGETPFSAQAQSASQPPSPASSVSSLRCAAAAAMPGLGDILVVLPQLRAQAVS